MFSGDKAVNKYLQNNVASEKYFPVAELQTTLSASELHFSKVLVIPVFNETADFLARLLNNPFAEQILLILVVNAPEQATPQQLESNQQLKHWLEMQANQLPLSHFSNLHTLYHFQNLSVLWVDCYSATRLKNGVGEARKLGCDLALQLMASDHIQHPIIFTTDADAHLPANYFDLVLAETESACVFNFKHLLSAEWQTAIDLYELHLRHYVTQLRRADSPYAFHTVGSLMALSARHYALAHGFPLRSAGEDFYLLNKLAKLGAVIQRHDIRIMLETRPSERVPFGTGPALRQIAALEQPERDYRFYHPEIFSELKIWLNAIPALFEQQTIALPTAINSVLAELGVFAFVDTARKQFRQAIQFEHAVHTHFDAFKTLKTVHQMRERFYPSVTWQLLAEHYQQPAQTPAQLLAFLERID